MNRAQANLAALGVALLILTMTAGISLELADGAYASADREPEERRLAVTVSERMVSPETPITVRPNVLNGSQVDELNASRLRTLFPVTESVAIRVRLDERTLVTTADVSDGTTFRRIVLVERRQEVNVTPTLSPPTYSTTLPRRTPTVRIVIDSPPETTVSAVEANGRVVLRNESGLDGSFTVRLSRFETANLRFEADGPLPTGSVTLTYYPAVTSKVQLAVTVRE